MGLITKIGGSFKLFGTILSGGFSAGLAAAGTGATALTVALSASLPVIMGVVAAVALLAKGIKAYKESQDYDLQLSNLKDIQAERTEINERIKELTSYNGDLTESEKEELELLREQTAELAKQEQKQQKRVNKLLDEKVQSQVFKSEVTEDDRGRYIRTYYNALDQQLGSLFEKAQNGEQATRAYRAEVQEFISTWGDLADELVAANHNGKELNETELAIITAVSMARAENEELIQTYGDVAQATDVVQEATAKYADSFTSLPDKLQKATEALQKYKEATSVDYSSALKGSLEEAQKLQDKLTAGTANVFDIQAAVEYYLPEGTAERLNYDTEAMGAELGKVFSGAYGSVLSGEDPLAGFVQTILDNGNILMTESGQWAAKIDENNQLSIWSYEALAEYFGISKERAEEFGLAIQNQSDKYFYTNEQIGNMIDALATLGINSSNAESRINDIVYAMSELGNTTDPAVIQSMISALQEAEYINPEITVTTEGINDALQEIQEVKDETGDIPETKTTTITAIVNGLSNVENLSSAISRIYSKSATIQTNVQLMVNGRPVTLEEYRALHLAKGTDYSSGGLALVNDGAPINGSAAELIVEGDTARIANGGKMGITKLEHGAKVYTAAETQQILKNSQNGETDLGALLGGIKAFGSGTGNYDVSKYISPVSTPSNYDPSASGTITPTTSNAADRKKEFDEWLKEKKHYLAMDMITEAEYYRDLEIMNERYLKDQKDYLDDYWQHQEEIYQYQKRDLEDIVKLEEKLNNLAKAKTQKVLVYKDGMFQYMQNTEAIAKAQRAVSGYANGTTHATAGVHMVGEHGAELRVLGEGDGIIPADITKNLMKIGSMGVNGLNKSNGGETNYYNIQSVKLEKVDDVDSFFTGLKSLALQSSTART